jgi:signal transduction histidine kinase
LTVRTYAKQLTGIGSNIADQRAESFRVGQTLVVAEIDDTGHGIPEDRLPKIFEPFFTTKPTGKGTGLGLSVVKTIIDLHGATIDLRNLPTGGTRVTIMFRT